MTARPRRLRPAPPGRMDTLVLESLLSPAARPAPAAEPADLNRIIARVRRALPRLAADIAKPPAALLAELLDTPPRRRPRVLAARPVLRSAEFFHFIRNAAIEALPLHPERAERLASLAVQLSESAHHVELSRRQLLTAHCILASVHRLRRGPADADRCLERAGFLLTDPHPRFGITGNPVTAAQDRALYLRTLALRRWEQGNGEEAQALLAHAAQLHRPTSPESTRSRLLLGLLYVLEGVVLVATKRPRAAFHSAATLDPGHFPVTALFGRLGLALASAQADDLTRARELRREARELVLPRLADHPAALAYPLWLDARVATFTDPGDALGLLEGARANLLLHEMPFAATLATLDAVLFLAGERADLISGFLERAPLPIAIPSAVSLCQELGQRPRAGAGGAPALSKLALRRELAQMTPLLRRVCILRGIAVEPLPFV